QKPSTLICAMGQTQYTVGTANVRASCILLLATGNVGRPGVGANIFRGHDNVQGATDLGLDVTTLPLYYGLAEDAWRHWCRVWEVDYDWMLSRFVNKTFMETPGVTSTRWFDATLLPKDQVRQPDTMKAMFVMGHGGNTIVRMPQAAKGTEKLDLLVVCDPYPTTWAVLSERKNGTYILPACTSFEMNGSRTASNRSLQWGEQIVKPVFECKNDYDIMYLVARKLGYGDQMFKNIKVESGAVSAEDILREINRGGWSTGYCGQSPERLKGHMRNQSKFDVVTLRAPKDDPEVGGEVYGLPWPCWGKPEFKHPGTPVLYNTNLPVKEGGGTFRARFGVERNGVTLLAEGSYSQGSEIKDGYPEFTLGVLKKLGWDTELGSQELAVSQKIGGNNAELVQDMFVEINPADAAERSIKDGSWVWVTGPEGQSKARMKASITERIGKGVAWMPYHFAGWFQGVDQRSKYPKGADPIVLGESVNTLTTYGYDPFTGMQEPKATLCQIRAA